MELTISLTIIHHHQLSLLLSHLSLCNGLIWSFIWIKVDRGGSNILCSPSRGRLSVGDGFSWRRIMCLFERRTLCLMHWEFDTLTTWRCFIGCDVVPSESLVSSSFFDKYVEFFERYTICSLELLSWGHMMMIWIKSSPKLRFDRSFEICVSGYSFSIYWRIRLQAFLFILWLEDCLRSIYRLIIIDWRQAWVVWLLQWMWKNRPLILLIMSRQIKIVIPLFKISYRTISPSCTINCIGLSTLNIILPSLLWTSLHLFITLWILYLFLNLFIIMTNWTILPWRDVNWILIFNFFAFGKDDFFLLVSCHCWIYLLVNILDEWSFLAIVSIWWKLRGSAIDFVNHFGSEGLVLNVNWMFYVKLGSSLWSWSFLVFNLLFSHVDNLTVLVDRGINLTRRNLNRRSCWRCSKDWIWFLVTFQNLSLSLLWKWNQRSLLRSNWVWEIRLGP